MSEENKNEEIDKILKLLSKPISRNILSVLAGVNPGKFKGEISLQNGETQDKKE